MAARVVGRHGRRADVQDRGLSAGRRALTAEIRGLPASPPRSRPAGTAGPQNVEPPAPDEPETAAADGTLQSPQDNASKYRHTAT